MKNLIILLALFLSFPLFAQDKITENTTTSVDQTVNWMTKIASNSELRTKMMNMMIEQTEGNKEEMMKIVNSISGNKEMLKMVMENNNKNSTLEPRGIMSDSLNKSKLMKNQIMHKK